MRGDQLARQWRILRTIESKKQGATVAELATQEDCHLRTIWRDLAAIQEAGFPLYSEKIVVTKAAGALLKDRSFNCLSRLPSRS